jgi:hypothetical protein
MPLVRTTFFPDPIEVPDDEVPVLRAQGLLVEETALAAPASEPAKVAAPKPKESI